MKPICELQNTVLHASSSETIWCWLMRPLNNSFPSVSYSKIAPTVILDAPEDSLVMNDEIFGPLLPIITVKVYKFWLTHTL